MGLGCGLILAAILMLTSSLLSLKQTQTAGALTDEKKPDNISFPAKDIQNQGTSVSSNSNDQNQKKQTADKQTVDKEPANNANLKKDSYGEENSTEIVIAKGMTAQGIAVLLEKKKLIANKEDFLNLVAEQGVSSKFNVGSFRIVSGWDTKRILAELLKN